MPDSSWLAKRSRSGKGNGLQEWHCWWLKIGAYGQNANSNNHFENRMCKSSKPNGYSIQCLSLKSLYLQGIFIPGFGIARGSVRHIYANNQIPIEGAFTDARSRENSSDECSVADSPRSVYVGLSHRSRLWERQESLRTVNERYDQRSDYGFPRQNRARRRRGGH